jgi:tungstate transport system substrate-binding protein
VRWVSVTLAVWLAVAGAACDAGGRRVVVAAGTTLVDSGLIDLLAADFETAHPGVEVSVVGDASASILELARAGTVDVTLTHAPDLEESFIAEGRSGLTLHVFSSRFILVGPAERANLIRGSTVAEAFDTIAAGGWAFVSRADGSGTNLVEEAVWRSTGPVPRDQSWYIETGQGMGPTLQVASERQAFTLSELGSFLTATASLDLVDAEVVSEAGLVNPYRAMVVAGTPAEAASTTFVEWLGSEEGRRSLEGANRRLFGETIVFATDGNE